MPLPDKVIEQLGREPPKTPGWSFGILTFTGGIFFIVVLIYVGLIFGYEPYLNAQVAKTQDQINQLSQQVSADDQTKLINFYSEISNLKSLLKNHVISSQLFTWLEKHTGANVFFDSFGLASGNQLTITGVAKSQADVSQQVAIFEADPDVKTVTLSQASVAQAGGWSFAMTVTVDPALMQFSQ